MNAIIAELEACDEAEVLLRQMIVRDGGAWPTQIESKLPHVVEIQYYGIIGIGLDPRRATLDWLANAQRECENQARFSFGAGIAHRAFGDGPSSVRYTRPR
ncbi:hypothetical protein [Oricola sp.]|uniref:hypothetical protein n=1 Tax=Oricola sp. TaxID=1979950 RepID=UPI0025F165F3|nr:hypothetical protein [Oricola sp.]